MLAVLRKELKMYYCSLFAYVYYMIFFLAVGVLFSNNCLTNSNTQFGYYVMHYVFWIVAMMIPICAMRMFSMERREKTDQMLYTAPVSTVGVLVGKYLATLIYLFVPVVLSLIYPCVIHSYGTLNFDFLMCAYIGGCLMIFAILSICIFISTLTANSILSMVLCYVVFGMFLLLRVFEQLVQTDSVIYGILHESSIFNKYNDMISGIVRSGDVVYFAILGIAFFVLAWLSLLNYRRRNLSTFLCGFGTVCLAVIGCFLAFRHTKVYDFTPEKILTLSDKTIESVSGVEEDTYIYYMGEKSRANATYVELLNEYADLNSHIFVEYVPLEDQVFADIYLKDLPEVNEASMVVATAQRYIVLDSEDYVTVSQSGTYSYDQIIEIEDQLTSSILYTNSKDTITVVRGIGHGEKVLPVSFTNLMNRNHYEMKTLNISEDATDISSSLTENVAALFIYSPQEDFSQQELQILDNYLKKGGTIMVSIDPLNEDLTNFFDFLKERGLSLQTGVVIDKTEGNYVLDTENYLRPYVKESKYTEEVIRKHLNVITYTSKGIARYGNTNGYEATDLLISSDASFSKVDNFDSLTSQGENDINGPFSIASVAKNPEEGTVFLIASDVFFNQEADEESGGANRRFFVEIMKKLTSNTDTVWVEGKVISSQDALYPQKMLLFTKVFTMAVIPLLILVTGILLLIGRKKNVGWNYIEKKRCKKNLPD